MDNMDSSWYCVSSRCEDDVSTIIPVGEPYDNGVCLDWFQETKNLSNASYKPIRDQILQMEHVKIAYALEFLSQCGIPRRNINFLRTDAIILSTAKKKMILAKQGLVNVTRKTLNKPKAWLFPSAPVKTGSAGEGNSSESSIAHCPPRRKRYPLQPETPYNPTPLATRRSFPRRRNVRCPTGFEAH